MLDDDGGEISGETSVTVNNVAPSDVVIAPLVDDRRERRRHAEADVRRSRDARHAHGRDRLGRRLGRRDADRRGRARFFSDDAPVPRRQPDGHTDGHATRSSVRVLDDDGGASAPRRRRSSRSTTSRRRTCMIAPLATIDENDVATLTLTFDDPGTLDTHKVEIDWGDGSAVETLTVAGGLAVLLDDAPVSRRQPDRHVVGRVHGAAFASSTTTAATSPTATATITVNNVAPSSVRHRAAGDDQRERRRHARPDVRRSRDARHAPVEIDWGDGSAVETLTVAGGIAVLLDDAPVSRRQPDRHVVGRLHGQRPRARRRQRRRRRPRRRSITVNNVAPSNVQIAPLATIDENDFATLNLTFDDPGTLDTHKVEIDWGDGSAVETLTVTAGSRFFSTTHQYLDDNPTVTSSDMLHGRASASSTTTAASSPADDGHDHRQQRGAVGRGDRAAGDDQRERRRHAGADVRRSGHARHAQGRDRLGRRLGGRDARRSPPGRGSSRRPTSTWTTTPRGRRRTRTPSASACWTTTAARRRRRRRTVTVKNVAPSNVAVIPAASTLDEGGPISLDFTFDDPGTLDTHTYQIDWGDGNFTTGAAAGHGFAASHTYADNGNYTVKVTVTDDDSGVGMGMGTVTRRQRRRPR